MFCKNCGQKMDNGVCSNCGWRADSLEIQPQLQTKKSKVLPILYIIAVVLTMITCLFLNYGIGVIMETSGLETKGGGFWFFLHAVVMLVPAYFLMKQQNLKWCAIFLLIGIGIYIIGFNYCSNIGAYYDQVLNVQVPSNDSTWDQAYNGLQSAMDDSYQEEYIQQKIMLDAIRTLVKASTFLLLVSAVVLAAGILFTTSKKTYTVLLVIACVLAVGCNLMLFFAILFMGISIRKNYAILQSEKKNKVASTF